MYTEPIRLRGDVQPEEMISVTLTLLEWINLQDQGLSVCGSM
jgi:hypothetical protein